MPSLQEHDVATLLLHYAHIASTDDGPGFQTFKRAWKGLGFSHVMQNILSPLSRSQYQQSWYNAALDAIAHGVTQATVELVRHACSEQQPPKEHDNAHPSTEERDVVHAELESMLLAPIAAPEEPAVEEELTHEELALILGEAPASNGRNEQDKEPRDHDMDAPPSATEEREFKLFSSTDVDQIDATGQEIRSAALFCLYCLFVAQPCRPRVKVYLTTEQAQMLHEYAELLETSNRKEEICVLTQLWRAHAFVPGASGVDPNLPPVPVPHRPKAVSRFGAEIEKEEAATLREIRFNLSSGLRGLGTKHVALLYERYHDSLAGLWDVATAEGPAGRPQAIADLDLGKLLAEFASAKEMECLVLLEGDARKLRQVRAALPKGKRRRRKRDNLVRMDATTMGLPSAARRVMEREAARKLDMVQRVSTWAPLLGEGNDSGTAVDDMPDLPGLPPEPSQTGWSSRRPSGSYSDRSESQEAVGPEKQALSLVTRPSQTPSSALMIPAKRSRKQAASHSTRARRKRDGNHQSASAYGQEVPAPNFSSPEFEALGRDAAMLAALASQALEEDDDEENSGDDGLPPGSDFLHTHDISDEEEDDMTNDY